jgi:hypothetical protein
MIGIRRESEKIRGVEKLDWYRHLKSPRKEVIQPHLPVRLPCYDLAPITDLTLGGCPPYGLAHRLRVLPTFVA